MARRPIGAFVAALATAAALTACAGSAPPRPRPVTTIVNSSPSRGPSPSAADWPTYHHDGRRSGAAAGVAPVQPHLRVAWRRPLDGAVYAQPLIVAGRVIAATEGGTIYALTPGGQPIWHRHIAPPVPQSDLPCGDIDPLGITGTPAYDPASGLIFAVTETTGGRHLLAGVRLSDGKLAVLREVEPPRGDPIATQQRPALAVTGGRVYIAFGGLEGDCANYVGSVVSVPTSGTGARQSYAVPTSREAGIWATGGVVQFGGQLYVSVGNGASTTSFDGSDSVIALSPSLHRTGFFAPSSWRADNGGDADLGSMTPAAVGRYLFISGKNGIGYVLDPARLGGIGGQIAQLRLCAGFGTAAVTGNVVYVPCQGTGVRQVLIGPGGTPQAGWTAQAAGAHGSPVTGGGAVWVVDYDGGVLYALNPASGAILAQVTIGPAPHFAAPSLSGSQVYVGTMSGVVAVSGA